MMSSKRLCASIAVFAALLMAAPSWSQQVISYPVDLTAFWNVDGYNAGNGDDAGDPILGTMFLDDGGKRIRSWTFPDTFVDGQPNYTEDGLTQFLLGPVYEQQAMDAYRPDGSTIPAPEQRSYDRLYLALMSGNGEFPGTAWKDKDVMTVNYADGSSESISIGVVNDWFWKPPEWYKPASGNPSEILADILCHASDPDEFDLYLWDWSGTEPTAHDYGQYRWVDGEGEFLTYQLPYAAGAKLYMEMWGNIQVLVSTDDPAFDPDFPMTEIYNSATADQVYPGGGDGYTPNRKKYEFDLSSVLPSGTTEFYLRFKDAAPGQATAVDSGNWGARIHRIGLFTGPVVLSSAGARLFSGLVRDGDGAAPSGGLILIRKAYALNGDKALKSITMPSLLPNAAPFLTCFGMTLGVIGEGTGISEFSLY
ncbi:MAG: hypothetical protein GC154_13840 [bacterium]|nr:hypothetical protein [bacterium]